MRAKELARCAVMTALLIAVQFALSFISGVELVTAVFSAFCYVFGVRDGVLTAISFSLLRCLIFGFAPSVIVLYLIYYPAFALVFGSLPKLNPPRLLIPCLIFLASVLCAALGIFGIPVSAIYIHRVKAMLWVLFVIFSALDVIYLYAYIRKGSSDDFLELFNVTSAAALMTVLFTLLDDLITPLLWGYSKEAAVAYFYSGFLAMLPQTICAAISVFALFKPLKGIMAASGKGRV